jgi:hypothetical protein
VWLVGGDRASSFVREGGLLAVAARMQVVVVQQLSVFRPALRIHEAKTSRLGLPRVVSA